MANEEKKEEKEPTGWASLLKWLFKEYRSDFLKAGGIAAGVLFVLDPMLRALLSGVFGRIEEFGRDVYKQVDDAARNAARGLASGLIVSLALVVAFFYTVATKATAMERFPQGTLIVFALVATLIWTYGRIAAFVFAVGAANGFLSAKQIAEFKYAGGFALLQTTLFGGKSAFTGGLHGLWVIGQKFGQIIRWVTCVAVLALFVPLHNAPVMLWPASLIIVAEISLHAFNQRNDRPHDWQILHRWMLMILAGIADICLLPELLKLLGNQHVTPDDLLALWNFSFITRLLVAALANWLVWKSIKTAALTATHPDDPKPAADSTATAGPRPSPKPSAPSSGNLLGRAITGVTLVLMFSIPVGIAAWAWCHTDHGQRIYGASSPQDFQSGRWVKPKDWHLPSFGAKDAEAKSLPVTQAPAPSPVPSPATTLTTTVTFMAGPGDRRGAQPLMVEKGDILSFKIVDGVFISSGEEATTDGTWGGKEVSPQESTQSLQAQNFDPKFLSLSEPYGAIFYRLGPGAPLKRITEDRVIVDRSGEVLFAMNIPTNPVMASSFGGDITIEVTIERPNK